MFLNTYKKTKQKTKSEAELLVYKTHNCQADRACWLLSTLLPSPPRPHLLQVAEERTVQLLIPCEAPPRLALAIQETDTTATYSELLP